MAKDTAINVMAKAMVEKIYNDGYSTGFKHGVCSAAVVCLGYCVVAAAREAYQHNYVNDREEDI